MTKKDVKELKFITYINKVYILLWCLSHKNFKVKCALLEVVLCSVTSCKLFLVYVRRQNMLDSCLSTRIIFGEIFLRSMGMKTKDS